MARKKNSRALVAICESELTEVDLNRFKDRIKAKIRALRSAKESQAYAIKNYVKHVADAENELDELRESDPVEWCAQNPAGNEYVSIPGQFTYTIKNCPSYENFSSGWLRTFGQGNI